MPLHPPPVGETSNQCHLGPFIYCTCWLTARVDGFTGAQWSANGNTRRPPQNTGRNCTWICPRHTAPHVSSSQTGLQKRHVTLCGRRAVRSHLSSGSQQGLWIIFRDQVPVFWEETWHQAELRYVGTRTIWVEVPRDPHHSAPAP